MPRGTHFKKGIKTIWTVSHPSASGHLFLDANSRIKAQLKWAGKTNYKPRNPEERVFGSSRDTE